MSSVTTHASANRRCATDGPGPRTRCPFASVRRCACRPRALGASLKRGPLNEGQLSRTVLASSSVSRASDPRRGGAGCVSSEILTPRRSAVPGLRLRYRTRPAAKSARPSERITADTIVAGRAGSDRTERIKRTRIPSAVCDSQGGSTRASRGAKGSLRNGIPLYDPGPDSPPPQRRCGAHSASETARNLAAKSFLRSSGTLPRAPDQIPRA